MVVDSYSCFDFGAMIGNIRPQRRIEIDLVLFSMLIQAILALLQQVEEEVGVQVSLFIMFV